VVPVAAEIVVGIELLVGDFVRKERLGDGEADGPCADDGH